MESFFLRVAVCFCFVHKIAFSLFAKLCAHIEGILYMANVTLAIAQWIRLRLPSCHPRFDSQACHLRFFHLVKFGLYLFMRCAKRTKINKKEAGFGPFLKIQYNNIKGLTLISVNKRAIVELVQVRLEQCDQMT